MHLQSRLVMAFALALLAVIVFDGIVSFHYERRQAIEVLRTQAEVIRSTLMAVRRVYHHQFMESGLPVTPQTLGFLPAHAMPRISQDFVTWDESGVRFNTVSDRPRNPQQQADGIELQAITAFRNNPKNQVFFEPFTDDSGRDYYLYARPLWVEAYCLQCHGASETAPATIRAQYHGGFDYKLGDLRGIFSLRIPADGVSRKAWSLFAQRFTVHLAGFAVIVMVTAYFFRRYINRPIARLEEAMRNVADGDVRKRLTGVEGELGRVQTAFNVMAFRLEEQRGELLRLWRAVEQCPVSIVITNRSGNIVYVNPFFERVTGYSRSEVMGRNPKILSAGRMPSEHYRKMWDTLMAGGTWHGQFINRRRDGSLYIEEADVSGVLDADGHLGHFVAVKEDVTERQHMLEKLHQSMDDLRRFATVAAHDLQEPVRTVVSFLQLLARHEGGRLDHVSRDYIQHATAGALRMHDQLLGLSEFLAVDQDRPPFAVVDCNAVFRQVMYGLGELPQMRGAVVTIAPDLPLLWGDQDQMVSLFAQLLDNALKFSHPQRSPDIRVSAHVVPDGYWEIVVADNGIGISEEYRESVFGVFSRLDPIQYEGVGVGLALCRRIVIRHGGTIRVADGDQGGAALIVTLPGAASGSS